MSMTIPSFREFLTEDAATAPLTHLQHLEDLMLDDGVSGFLFAKAVLEEFHTMLRHGGVSRALNVTTKWDGAPSIVFGPDPADGQFFVATKSAFSKTPKLMKSHGQIHAEYGDSGLANKLHTCFTELSALQPTRILQGDLLFTDDVTPQTVEGRTYLTFRPNTIVYAIDTASDLAKRIQRAAVGLVIHTMYSGSGTAIGTYRPSPIAPAVFASLKKTPRVVVIDRTFDDVSGTVSFTESEDADFELALARITQLSRSVSPKTFTMFATSPLHELVQMFINAQVRGGVSTSGAALYADLLVFLGTRKQKELASRKTQAAQDRITQQYAILLQDLMSAKRECTNWFTLHNAIAAAKTMVVRKLGQASRIGTFLPTSNGLVVTGHEGYVAVSHTGKMVKIVDRLEFSRANFLSPKTWS